MRRYAEQRMPDSRHAPISPRKIAASCDFVVARVLRSGRARLQGQTLDALARVQAGYLSGYRVPESRRQSLNAKKGRCDPTDRTGRRSGKRDDIARIAR